MVASHELRPSFENSRGRQDRTQTNQEKKCKEINICCGGVEARKGERGSPVNTSAGPGGEDELKAELRRPWRASHLSSVVMQRGTEDWRRRAGFLLLNCDLSGSSGGGGELDGPGPNEDTAPAHEPDGLCGGCSRGGNSDSRRSDRDAGKQQHSFGGGGQRNQHSRPFFYVQPPSQPYQLYPHWPLGGAYPPYGMPAGFNYGRPCMQPYPYMPYPGFVLPQAPIYPMDYRRMFEPRFHAPAWGDSPRQQQQQQGHRRRETACSEAQTEPSDAITKLLECLDKIRASDLQGADRELDSGMFSPGEDKHGEQGRGVPSASGDSCLESTSATLGDPESGQMLLEPLSPGGCWLGGLEEELPLDSSSVHEERRSASDGHFLVEEKDAATDVQSDLSLSDPGAARGEELLKAAPPLSHRASQSSPVKDGDLSEGDGSCQILKLPFDPAAAEAGQLSSSSAPYYYNYLSMQTTHERMSVLSPSLDELSSRDEVFSTDLEDVDLFPKAVYAGRRLSEVIGSPSAAHDEEVWLPHLKGVVCACCGKGLAKGPGRTRAGGSKMYWDDGGDSEDDGRFGRGCERPVRVVVRKHAAHRKAAAPPPRHAARHWCKRGQYQEGADAAEPEGSRGACKHEAGGGESAELDGGEQQCRTCQDRVCRENLTTAEQSRWADGDVVPRRRPATPMPRHETSAQWKLMYQRPRDETREEPPQWERGSLPRFNVPDLS
ncbi:bucky ball, partial [Cololabis saira]|uniref:bucky ball n=1 Tax=Cololabis saira TaxID=129043 RepID=UPI002AD3C4C6